MGHPVEDRVPIALNDDAGVEQVDLREADDLLGKRVLTGIAATPVGVAPVREERSVVSRARTLRGKGERLE